MTHSTKAQGHSERNRTMKNYLTNNSSETLNLGEDFAKNLEGGDLVLLYGDLGAGKTTFVQGLARGLGIKDRILSPTFVLIRQYEIPHPTPLLKGEGGNRKNSRQARTRNLYHVDLYRIEKQNDIESLGLDEIINEKESVTAVEWADRLLDFKQKKGYKVWFENTGEDKRKIIIQKLT